MLERHYGRQVEMVYRCHSKIDAAKLELPLVRINGEVITSGGLTPSAVIDYLNRLGIPRS